MNVGPTSQNPPAILGLYRNNKNGGIYTALTTVTNTTNAQDRQQMVLYVSGAQLFVREREEFLLKFTSVSPGGCRQNCKHYSRWATSGSSYRTMPAGTQWLAGRHEVST